MNSATSKDKKSVDTHDSEGEDYVDPEAFKGGARKATEKQQEIDELSKRLRYIELDFKKKEIELNSELANERQRADELQEILTKKLGDMKENREANELQERLSMVEDELFEKQQIAHEMLRQLTEMELENEQLKADMERHKSGAAISNNSVSPARQKDQNIDVDKIVNRCMELESEKQELSLEVEQIRRGAIEAIVEKEKMILDLQETLDSLQHAMTSDSLRYVSSTADSEYQMKEEIDHVRQECQAELLMMNQRCEELQLRLEEEQKYHEEQLHSLDASISQRVFENLQQHIDSAKSNEADLLQQLSMLEERVKYQDRLFADSQKLLGQTRDELKREKEASENKISRLTKQCENYDELTRQFKSLTKEAEDSKKQAEKDIAEKQNSIDKLSAKRDELVKNAVNLDSDNRRLRENLVTAKTNLTQLEATVESLYAQIDEIQRESQLALKAAADKHESDKTAMLAEVVRVKQIELQEKKKVKIEQEMQVNPVNEVFSTEVLEEQSQSVSNVEKLPQSAEKPIRQQSEPSILATPTSKSTMLGIEFADEDFNFEEEKTESTSAGRPTQQHVLSYSTSKSPPQLSQQQLPSMSSTKKKKSSFNIIESPINPLQIILASERSGGSTRNQFKKQFMFTPQQNQQPSLPQPQQPQPFSTSNAQEQQYSDVNVFEMRARINKLEGIVQSYEVTIEKLQNESKQTLKQLQEARREKVLSNKEADLIDELNSFKMHCHRVETQFVTQKLQLTEDLHFLKEEVHILEGQNTELKEALALATSERDFYQAKYTRLKGVLKQRRAGGSLGGINGQYYSTSAASSSQSYYPEHFEQANSYHTNIQQQQYQQQQQLQQQQQQQQNKKKTFWIFK